MIHLGLYSLNDRQAPGHSQSIGQMLSAVDIFDEHLIMGLEGDAGNRGIVVLINRTAAGQLVAQRLD